MQLVYACVRGCTCRGWEGADSARFTPEMLTAAPATGSSPLLCTQPSQLEGFPVHLAEKVLKQPRRQSREGTALGNWDTLAVQGGGGFAAVHLAGVQKALLGEW